ncbi:unnamed protein product, partial [Polarella glacialis]
MFRAATGPLRRAPGALGRPASEAAYVFRPGAGAIGHVRPFYEDAATSGSNALYLESIYSQWKLDSSKLDPRWDPYFTSLEAGKATGAPPLSGDAARKAALAVATSSSSAAPKAAAGKHSTTRVIADDSAYTVDPVGLKHLIRAFQVRGHENANLDPLAQHQWRSEKNLPELTAKFHGFSEADLAIKVSAGNMLWRGSTGGTVGFLSDMGSLGVEELSLGELIEIIRSTYCGTMAVEYMHILDRKRCNWIRQRVECPTFLHADRDQMLKVYERLCYSDGFERFLGDKFKNTKRFGLDGGEAVIPGLQ